MFDQVQGQGHSDGTRFLLDVTLGIQANEFNLVSHGLRLIKNIVLLVWTNFVGNFLECMLKDWKDWIIEFNGAN